MNLGEILAEFRVKIKDRVKPYLVDDAEAISLFVEAQLEAARRARLIVDSVTDGVAKVAVSAGLPVVEISPTIISIRRIRLLSSAAPLRTYMVRDMDELAPGWDTATSTSQPSVAVVDYQTNALRLYPTPRADDTLLMTVVREPIGELSADTDVPELASRYHLGCIEWMKYRVFSGEDTDLYDEKKAAVALKRFEDDFGPAIGAINERFEFERYHDVGER